MVGLSRADLMDMGWWEFNARVEGWRAANCPPDAAGSVAPTADEFDDALKRHANV